MVDPVASTVGSRRVRASLSVRYIGLILLIVIISGVILGAAVSLSALRNAAEERMRSIEYASQVVAASLLPVIADQDPERIRAQLAGIVETSDLQDIQCIELIDNSGAVIAETESQCTCDLVEPSTGLLDVFTKAQVVRVPIDIEGMPVATVSVQFRSVGLERALIGPLTTTALILGMAMVVSASWGGWMVLRTVVEPIERVRDAAESIAGGSRTISLDTGRGDEIGELARALHDMTRQLEAQEQELLGSYSSLEGAFEEKAELARRLERTMSMKSDFVAVASHEIRSPLTVIQLYAEMLTDNEFGEVDPEAIEAIESIADAVRRLNAIVASLLDVALLERGVMPLEYSEVDVADLAAQAADDARLIGRETGVVVVYEGPTSDVTLTGDAIRLRQVFDNILSNAVKYSASGTTVAMGLKYDHGSVTVTVDDEGVGIPVVRAGVLFELFGRAETADNARVAGLGLGLAITNRIVQAHAGEISFAGNPAGQGTRFVVSLPRSVQGSSGRPGEISIASVEVDDASDGGSLLSDSGHKGR